MAVRSLVLAAGLLVAGEARGQWYEFGGNGRLDPFLGVAVAYRLGPIDRGSRVGVQLEGAFEWALLDDGAIAPTPHVRVGAHVGWTHPRWYTGLLAEAGASVSSGADGGYLHLVGVLAGGGLGLASDGFAGPVVAGRVVGPFSTVGLAADRVEGAWASPRFTIGPEHNLNCCATEL